MCNRNDQGVTFKRTKNLTEVVGIVKAPWVELMLRFAESLIVASVQL